MSYSEAKLKEVTINFCFFQTFQIGNVCLPRLSHGFHLNAIYLTLESLVVYQGSVKFKHKILHILLTIIYTTN